MSVCTVYYCTVRRNLTTVTKVSNNLLQYTCSYDWSMAVGIVLYACIVLGITSIWSTPQQHITNGSISIADRIKACCQLLCIDDNNNDDVGSSYTDGYNYSSLFAQIDDTVRSSYIEHVESSLEQQQQRGVEGPKLNVLLVTRSTENIYPYSVYSYLLQLIYSRVNGYLLAPVNSASFNSSDDYEYYPKLSILLYHIQRPDVHADYVVWIDAGTVAYSPRTFTFVSYVYHLFISTMFIRNYTYN